MNTLQFVLAPLGRGFLVLIILASPVWKTAPPTMKRLTIDDHYRVGEAGEPFGGGENPGQH